MRLKELREERNLTQWDVANGIKTSQRNIGRWEKGEVLPSSDFVIKIADFFQVSADYLLSRSDDFGNISIQETSPAKTEEEETLLQYFRMLSPELQGAALDTVRVLAGIPAGGLQKKA